MSQLSPQDLSTLHRELLDLVRAEVPLPEGLRAFVSSLDAGPLEASVQQLSVALEQGTPLSEALAGLDRLPADYVALLAAGEASGDLPSVLEGIVEQAELDALFRTSVRDSLIYPAISLGVAIVFGTLALSRVAGMEQLFASLGVSLPWLTEVILAAGAICRDWFALVLALGITLAATLPRWLHWPGRLLTWPFVQPHLRWRQLAGFSRSMAAFVRHGVPLVQGLTALRLAAIPYLPTEQLQRIEDRLAGGASLADALRPEPAAFPPTFVWRVGAAQTPAQLEQALRSLSRRYEERLRRRLALVTGLVTPVVLIAVACLAGVIMLSVFLPIFELQRALQQ